MNGMIESDAVVVDTSVIINHLNGQYRLEELGIDAICYSIISYIEIFAYPHLTKSMEKKIERLLQAMIRVDLDVELAKIAVSLRKNYRLKVPDAIIAATAEYLGLPLISFDLHFEKFPRAVILTR